MLHFARRSMTAGRKGNARWGLYAVDEEYHGRILEWLKQERFGGMGLLPLRYRLDGVKVVLEGKN